MFTSEQLLALVLFCILSSFVGAKKCIPGANVYSATCLGLDSLDEVSRKVKPEWTDVTVVNNAASTFHVTEFKSRNLDLVESFDLSKAGSILISDYGFKDLPSLRILNISGTSLTTLKTSYFHPTSKVLSIDASFNKLNSIYGTTVVSLLNLQLANFSHNQIAAIQFNAFQPLTELKYLDMSCNLLKSISFGEVPKLEYLSVDNNSLEMIHSNDFVGMPQLQYLSLSGNQLKSIDENSFQRLTKLIDLYLSNNSISELPGHLFERLKLLKILDISQNAIKILNPDSFSGLKSLKKLELTDNAIADIKQGTFSPLINLGYLDLSGNRLTTLNKNIFADSMPKLKKLFLSGNRLKTLPYDVFHGLPSVDFLVLGHNSYSNLDGRMFTPLRNLKKLHLSHNDIKEFPTDVVESLNELTELLIDHNKLTFLPELSNQFPSLVKIFIEGNPWQCPCFDELVEYFELRKILYQRPNGFYDGGKPVCEVTKVKTCERNLKAA